MELRERREDILDELSPESLNDVTMDQIEYVDTCFRRAEGSQVHCVAEQRSHEVENFKSTMKWICQELLRTPK